MGVAVKVSEELVDAAKRVGEVANRSVTRQIEHWAELGRAVEHLAPVSDLAALKAHLTDPADVAKTAEAHVALQHLAAALADSRDRAAALNVIHNTGMPVYGAAPGRDDRVLKGGLCGGYGRRTLTGTSIGPCGPSSSRPRTS